MPLPSFITSSVQSWASGLANLSYGGYVGPSFVTCELDAFDRAALLVWAYSEADGHYDEGFLPVSGALYDGSGDIELLGPEDQFYPIRTGETITPGDLSNEWWSIEPEEAARLLLGKVAGPLGLSRSTWPLSKPPPRDAHRGVRRSP